MQEGFVPFEEEYNGDIIKLDKLIEFIPSEHWSWDESGEIDMEDISIALCNGVDEVPEPYGDESEIHCRYGGRMDVLDYLQGKIRELECEPI